MAEQPEFRPPNFTIQEASQYKADIDSSVKLLGRIGAAFAAHEKSSIAEVSEVTTVADVGGNLDGTYFTLSAPSEDFYVWFNSTDISGLSDPGLSGVTGLQVDFANNDAAATIAAAINAVVDAQALLNSSVAGDIVTISNRDQGAVTDIADGLSGNATGFSFLITTQGGDGPTDLQVNIDAGFVLNDSAASGKNGIEDIAAQVIPEGSGSIIAPSVNPRIDRIVIDIITGTAEVVTGSEAASPAIPDIPDGKVPNCRFRLETSTTTITNSLIVDERAVVSYGKQTENIPVDLGDSDVTLDRGETNRRLIIDPSAPRVITLPGSGLVKGDIIEIHNINASNKITLIGEASGAADIASFQNGSMRIMALVNFPRLIADWRILDVFGGASPSFRADKNGVSQSGITTAETQVTFSIVSSATYDINGNFASNAFIPTVPGKYNLSIIIALGSLTADELVQTKIRKNGVDEIRVAKVENQGSPVHIYSIDVEANGIDDDFDITVDSTADGSYAVIGGTALTKFMGHRIGN